MQRITKELLETRIKQLNNVLKARGINKVYKIGYRYNRAYIDQKSLTAKGCITGDSSNGTKREVYELLNFALKVLQSW